MYMYIQCMCYYDAFHFTFVHVPQLKAFELAKKYPECTYNACVIMMHFISPLYMYLN